MKKLFLLLSFALITPICQAGFELPPEKATRKERKAVGFAPKVQVRTFKSSEPVNNKPSEPEFEARLRPADDQTVPAAAPKQSLKIRTGNGILGLAMMWAGIYAVPTAIKHPGDNAFFRAVSIGAFVSGVVITLAGFKKIEYAIRG